MDTGQIIQSWAALLIIFGALGALLGVLNKVVLQRQLAQVQRRIIPPGIAYRNFLGAWILLLFFHIFLFIIACFISVSVISANSVSADEVFPLALRMFLAGLLPIFWLSLMSYFLVAEGTAMVEAIKLTGVNVTRGQAILFRLKALLLPLPAMLVIEAAIIILAFSPSLWWLALFLFPLLILASLIVSAVRFRFLYPSQPLQQTEWASLEPRIQEWARLAKFPYKETRVTSSASFGFRDGNVGGLFKRTIYLSDGLLRNTDWRQRDAFIAFLFAMSRRRRVIYLSSVGFSVPVLFIVAGLFIWQILSPASVLTSLLVPFAVLLLVIALLIVRIVLRVSQTTGENRLPIYCDRMAAQLTGDPMAVMVLLNTINQLTGGMMGTINLFGANTGGTLMQQRMVRLDAMLRRPGPHAPYALQPVPSMTPVFFGPFSLTVPYQPSTPGPVPQTRYPDTPPAISPMSSMPPMPPMPAPVAMPPNMPMMPPGPMPPVMAQPPMPQSPMPQWPMPPNMPPQAQPMPPMMPPAPPMPQSPMPPNTQPNMPPQAPPNP